MLLASVWDDVESRAPVRGTPKSVPARVGMTAAIGVVVTGLSIFYRSSYLWILGVIVLFVLTLPLLWRSTFPKAVVFLGDISYSFYLVHYFVVKLFARVFLSGDTVTNIPFAVCMALLCYALTALASVLSYQIFEVRLTRVLRRWMRLA